MKKSFIGVLMSLVLALQINCVAYAKSFSEAVNENFWIYSTDENKEAVFKYVGSDVDREIRNNLPYEYTRANWFPSEVPGRYVWLDKDKAYKIYRIRNSAVSMDLGYHSVYDFVNYAKNNELSLLFTETSNWEGPVISAEKYITSMWGTQNVEERYRDRPAGSYYWIYNVTSAETQALVDYLFSVTDLIGIGDVECVKIIRHEPVTYIYIKADGTEYAIPFSTGYSMMVYSSAVFKLEFEFEEGKLYTAEEMYRSIAEQYEATIEQLIKDHEKEVFYGGVKLSPDDIPKIRESFVIPENNIMATSGEMAEKMQQVGLIKGNGDDLAIFDNLTRAEGITMLLRMIGEEENASQAQPANVFSDVDESHWACNNISYAYAEGLTKGTSETTFSPEEKLSAPQFMVMLLRAMGYDSYEGETLTLENANEIAKKVGFDTDFYDVQDLKRGHMATIASRALNVVTANGKTVAENLLDEGVITAKQFETISASDFYTVPYEEKESWKIEGYPAFPDVTQKHYAIYKEATRDNRTEVAFFDIENEQEGDCLVYDGSSLTLSDNARYINSVKYVLSGNTWIKFEEGYPAISNYASEVLASDLDIK